MQKVCKKVGSAHPIRSINSFQFHFSEAAAEVRDRVRDDGFIEAAHSLAYLQIAKVHKKQQSTSRKKEP